MRRTLIEKRPWLISCSKHRQRRIMHRPLDGQVRFFASQKFTSVWRCFCRKYFCKCRDVTGFYRISEKVEGIRVVCKLNLRFLEPDRKDFLVSGTRSTVFARILGRKRESQSLNWLLQVVFRTYPSSIVSGILIIFVKFEKLPVKYSEACIMFRKLHLLII